MKIINMLRFLVGIAVIVGIVAILITISKMSSPCVCDDLVAEIREVREENDRLKWAVLELTEEVRLNHYPEYVIKANGDIIDIDAKVDCVRCHWRRY